MYPTHLLTFLVIFYSKVSDWMSKYSDFDTVFEQSVLSVYNGAMRNGANRRALRLQPSSCHLVIAMSLHAASSTMRVLPFTD